ncbi:MAG: hypothetical protein DDT40_00617 [candidate division WS2 bacterium]|nr:hypothetical protein [Candidatus Psychracetigena formicireducens]
MKTIAGGELCVIPPKKIKNENMKTTKQIDTCSICGKKLNFWNTLLKKHAGEKVCTKCAWGLAKQEMSKARQEISKTKQETSKIQIIGEKMQKIGKKLMIGITIPIILFVVGLITLPIGIIFWIIGFFMFISAFFGDKSKNK